MGLVRETSSSQQRRSLMFTLTPFTGESLESHCTCDKVGVGKLRPLGQGGLFLYGWPAKNSFYLFKCEYEM